jgi:hemerythrin-like metal-binding protein
MNTPTMEWTGALVLDFEPMDNDHRLFVALLARAQTANDGALATCWQAVIEHTQRHFAREDRWMRKSHFANATNHGLQHRVVLKVMREGLAMAQAGDIEALRAMTLELASWFLKHTQSLDAALALHMRRFPALATND